MQEPGTATDALVRDVDYRELQRRFPGQLIARRGANVIASAPTYDELSDRLHELEGRWDGLIIQYIESPDVIAIY